MSADTAINAARSALVDHDPIHLVLEAEGEVVREVADLKSEIRSLKVALTQQAPASPLDADQVKALTYSTERAAERGVGIYAKRIGSWHQAIVGGAFVAGLTIGILAMHQIDIRQSTAEIDALRLNVPAVLNSIPAADLAEWTTLIRSNSAPHALIAAGRMVSQPSGQKAASITLWLEPAPQQTPASH